MLPALSPASRSDNTLGMTHKTSWSNISNEIVVKSARLMHAESPTTVPEAHRDGDQRDEAPYAREDRSDYFMEYDPCGFWDTERMASHRPSAALFPLRGVERRCKDLVGKRWTHLITNTVSHRFLYNFRADIVRALPLLSLRSPGYHETAGRALGLKTAFRTTSALDLQGDRKSSVLLRPTSAPFH